VAEGFLWLPAKISRLDIDWQLPKVMRITLRVVVR